MQRTRARHAEVYALREQGLGGYTIARRLGLDPKTERRYAEAADPEALLGPNGTARDSILDPFKLYLQQRCAEGVTGTNQLLAEIRARGYKGGQRTLRRYLISIRGRNEPAPVPPPARQPGTSPAGSCARSTSSPTNTKRNWNGCAANMSRCGRHR